MSSDDVRFRAWGLSTLTFCYPLFLPALLFSTSLQEVKVASRGVTRLRMFVLFLVYRAQELHFHCTVDFFGVLADAQLSHLQT